MTVNTKIMKINTTVDNHYNMIFVVDSRKPEMLNEFVRRIRNEKDLTVADVSRRSRGRISPAYVNKIEIEPNVNPSYIKIEALAEGLGVTITEITSLIKQKSANKEAVVNEQFENLGLKFSGLPPGKKEKAQALIELMDRELERLANEK